MKPYRIPVARPSFAGRERDLLLQCIDTGQASGGPLLAKFEREFGAWLDEEGARTPCQAMACSSGSTALALALSALGVGPGDEVIVPVLTFIAVPNAVDFCEATPVFVDVDPESWTMLPSAVEDAITVRTKAIITVALYGAPVNKMINLLAAEFAIPVVDDAAEALGSRGQQGWKSGTLGALGVFSFYGNKVITTGEGGMVVTRRADLAERVRLLRGQGLVEGKRYEHSVIGYNFRMSEFQAAVGVAQFEKLPGLLAARRQVRAWYEERLPAAWLQKPNPYTNPAFWHTAVFVPGRDPVTLAGMLEDRGIETRPIFKPMDMQRPYLREAAGSYPNAANIYRHGLVLPTFAGLKEGEVDEICEVVLKW